MKVETKKVKPFLVHIHNAGLGGMKGQFQSGHDLLDLLQGFLSFPLSPTDDHKIIRVTNQLSQG
jgi:hypothetical protein